VQQGIELGGHELAHAAQGFEQLAGRALAVGVVGRLAGITDCP